MLFRSSNLCKALLKQEANFFGNHDLEKDTVQIPLYNSKKYKFVFKNFKHKLLKNDQHIEEKIDFVVFSEYKYKSKELYRETLDINPDYLNNLIKKENENYRDYDLLEYAKKHIR